MVRLEGTGTAVAQVSLSSYSSSMPSTQLTHEKPRLAPSTSQNDTKQGSLSTSS